MKTLTPEDSAAFDSAILRVERLRDLHRRRTAARVQSEVDCICGYDSTKDRFEAHTAACMAVRS